MGCAKVADTIQRGVSAQCTYKKEEVKRLSTGTSKIVFDFFRGVLPRATGASCRGSLMAPDPGLKALPPTQSLLDTRASPAMVAAPGEAESGSAGVQPDEEYPGRRCTDGASASEALGFRGFFLPIGHRSHALENPPSWRRRTDPGNEVGVPLGFPRVHLRLRGRSKSPKHLSGTPRRGP
jgi:hypothetical protein